MSNNLYFKGKKAIITYQITISIIHFAQNFFFHFWKQVLIWTAQMFYSLIILTLIIKKHGSGHLHLICMLPPVCAHVPNSERISYSFKNSELFRSGDLPGHCWGPPRLIQRMSEQFSGSLGQFNEMSRVSIVHVPNSIV